MFLIMIEGQPAMGRGIGLRGFRFRDWAWRFWLVWGQYALNSSGLISKDLASNAVLKLLPHFIESQRALGTGCLPGQTLTSKPY